MTRAPGLSHTAALKSPAKKSSFPYCARHVGNHAGLLGDDAVEVEGAHTDVALCTGRITSKPCLGGGAFQGPWCVRMNLGNVELLSSDVRLTSVAVEEEGTLLNLKRCKRSSQVSQNAQCVEASSNATRYHVPIHSLWEVATSDRRPLPGRRASLRPGSVVEMAEVDLLAHSRAQERIRQRRELGRCRTLCGYL